MKDQIPGGLADHKDPKSFDQKAVAKGKKVEKEHTSSKSIAAEIARDHLTEDPKYYDKLEKIEKKAFWQGFEKQAEKKWWANPSMQSTLLSRHAKKRKQVQEVLKHKPLSALFDRFHTVQQRASRSNTVQTMAAEKRLRPLMEAIKHHLRKMR